MSRVSSCLKREREEKGEHVPISRLYTPRGPLLVDPWVVIVLSPSRRVPNTATASMATAICLLDAVFQDPYCFPVNASRMSPC